MQKPGVFKVGGKKENKSDLFLLKSKKDHFYLISLGFVIRFHIRWCVRCDGRTLQFEFYSKVSCLLECQGVIEN